MIHLAIKGGSHSLHGPHTYDFACGGWVDFKYELDDRPLWTVFPRKTTCKNCLSWVEANKDHYPHFFGSQSAQKGASR